MIAAASETSIGDLLCRTSDTRIAGCLERLVSTGFCPSADETEPPRTITWEQSAKTTDWNHNRVDALASTREASPRRWGNVCGFLHHDRPVFQLSDEASCRIVSPDRVCVHGPPAPNDPHWMELLTVVVFELLAAGGSVAVHAGAVTFDGHGILVVGPAASGKSTFIYLLLEAGGRYTADDVSLIFRRDDSWFARSTGEQFRVCPDVMVDEGLMRDEGLDAAGKLRLHPRRVDTFRPVTRVEQIVFLSADHGVKTTWRPLSRQETVQKLMSEVGLALSPAVASRQLVSLSELGQLPAVSMQGGEDLLGRPDRAASVVREMWAATSHRE